MHYFKKFAALAILPFLSSCAYQVPTNIRPTFSGYTAYDEKIPGSAAIYVDSAKARSDVRVTGLACSAHKFPVDAEVQIKSAVLGTLGNLIENVERVDAPLTRSQLAERGLAAMVFVKVEDIDVELFVIPGFWSADMRSEAEIVLGVKADTRDGRQLGATVSGRGKATANAGGACEGGAIAVGQSLNEATKEALDELAERVSNSERLRKSRRPNQVEASRSKRAILSRQEAQGERQRVARDQVRQHTEMVAEPRASAAGFQGQRAPDKVPPLAASSSSGSWRQLAPERQPAPDARSPRWP